MPKTKSQALLIMDPNKNPMLSEQTSGLEPPVTVPIAPPPLGVPLTSSIPFVTPVAPQVESPIQPQLPTTGIPTMDQEAMPSAANTESPPSAPPPKKSLPLKTIGLALGALVFVGLAAFFALRLLGPKTVVPEEITLNYWGLWEDSGMIQQLISEYEASNKRIKINYQKQSKEDYRERLVNNFAKGEGPDIFRFHNTWVPMLGSQLSTLPLSVMDAATYQNTFYPVAANDLRKGTNIVGIPLMFDGLAMYINEDIFTSSGKTAPITWDEMRRVARELTVRDTEGRISQAGVALGRTDNIDHWQDILAIMMLQDGADLANPVGETSEKPLKFYTVFATDDKVWDETMPPSTQAFAGGKLAMYFGPSWRAFEIKQLNPNLKFKVLPIPQLPKNDPSEPDITWATYWAEGVWAKSKNQNQAWEFLKFLSQKESLQKMYTESSKTRLFGEVYPRPDMASLLQNDPHTGAYAKQGAKAKSWYLTDRTFDGPTGINTRISNYYKDAVNGIINDRKEPADVLPTVAQGVSQVLQSYGMVR